jgi:hypothetical protein
VGAILILMLMNEDVKEFSFLTGSSVGVGIDSEERILEEMSRGEEITVRLDFDTAPEVKESTWLKSVKITFDDLSTKVRINEEELELKGLEGVEVEIVDFRGELDFDEISISLNGEGDKLVVNGIEISTKGKKMEISFKNLIYNSLAMEGVRLSLVNLDEGSGELAIGEKLNYKLDNEEISLKEFEGDLSVGLGESLMVMEGEVNGVSIEGEFDLTLG